MPRTGLPKKRLHTSKFHQDLIDRLKAKAEQERTSVTALLERGAEHVLAEPHLRLQPERRSEKKPDEHRNENRRAADVRLCARCGHQRASHWTRGCLAGCACGERLYRERAS